MGRGRIRRIGRQPDLGVLVCEALRERSEQRTNKYPEVGCLVSLVGSRGLPLRFDYMTLSFRASLETILPFRTMRGRRNLHSRDLVLGAAGCPVAVLGGYYIRAGFGIVECGVDDARLYARRDRCA